MIKEFKCKFCGETNQDKFYSHIEPDGRVRYIKSYCKKCHNKYTWNKKRDYKRIIVAEFGNKCSRCGYDKCIGALEFHHTNLTKDIVAWSKIRNRSIEYFRSQIKDCILVCANCHRELHYREHLEKGDIW